MIYEDVTRNEKRISGALALGMHLLFFVLLVVGVSWQQQRPDTTMIVDLWSNLLPPPRPKVETPPLPEVKPPPAPPKPVPKVAPKPPPKPEAKPVPKPDIALKEKREKERKRKELEDQKKKEDAERKLAEQKKREELEKKLAEQKKREEQKKRLAEQERQRKEEQARLEKEKEEQLSKLLAQQAAQAAAQAKLNAYKRSVSEKIKRYIVLPPNIQGNPEAQFDLVQIPGGEILSVKLKRSSGNPAYDDAVERAILKAQPLPPPPDPARFSEVRELELKFRPKE